MNLDFMYKVDVELETSLFNSDNTIEVYCEASSKMEAELTTILHFNTQKKLPVKKAFARLALNQNKKSYTPGTVIN